MTNQHSAFTSPSLSISGISRTLGDDGHLAVKALLNILIGDLVMFLNVGKNMSAGQIIETASLIIKHYPHLKPEDLKLCFENIKIGKYGALYDRMDGQSLLHCISMYDKERDYIAAEVASQPAFAKPAPMPALQAAPEPSDEEKARIFREGMDKLKAILAANKVGREKKPAEKQPQTNAIYEMHQVWMRRFDTLFEHSPYKARRGPRFILFRGNMMDMSAYLWYKQAQYARIMGRISK